jgi:ubiquinone/menaquinone biosynthesis C-methylase UbiE
MATIEFDKYKRKGAYHWKDFNRQSAYRTNALFIKDWIDGGKTLDIGAGDGLITSLLCNAIGIDDNVLAVNFAQERMVDVRLGDAYNLQFGNCEFDNVLMADVLEHLKDDKAAVLEVHRVLKPLGGYYIVTPPKITKNIHKYHYREYTPDDLVSFVKPLGFKLVGQIEVRPELNRMYAKFLKILKK